MNQIKAKIYYLISTGEVLAITSECQGCVEPSTKEQDMEIYPQLKDKNVNEIDYIELTYGSLTSTFNNVKSYSVNIETKTLDCIYYTQEELDVQKNKLTESQIIRDRITTILNYTNLDETIISDMEEFILLREKNRIIGGGDK
jgi:hypothetical protein